MSDNNNNGKRNRIPRGYTADDTQRRLDWLKEEQGFDYQDLDGNDPEDFACAYNRSIILLHVEKVGLQVIQQQLLWIQQRVEL